LSATQLACLSGGHEKYANMIRVRIRCSLFEALKLLPPFDFRWGAHTYPHDHAVLATLVAVSLKAKREEPRNVVVQPQPSLTTVGIGLGTSGAIKQKDTE
jgi:hypothetical protein